MNKMIALGALLFAACQPDTSDAQDLCTQVVKDGLATCTQDAWELCDQSYQKVLAEVQAENAQLRADLIKLEDSYRAGCDGYVNGAVADFMHANGCNYEPQSPYLWVCYGGRLCEAYDPAHP